MKPTKLLLQKFLQYATDFVFFTDVKVFSVISPNSRQDKVSGRLRGLLKKKRSIFFGAGTAWSAAAWPPVNCACVLQLFEQLINTMLCPASHEIRLSTYFAVYPFKYKLFIKILFLSLNTMLIVDKHCSDVCCDEFPMPQIDRRSK